LGRRGLWAWGGGGDAGTCAGVGWEGGGEKVKDEVEKNATYWDIDIHLLRGKLKKVLPSKKMARCLRSPSTGSLDSASFYR